MSTLGASRPGSGLRPRIGGVREVGAVPRGKRVLLVGPFPPTVGGVTTFLQNLVSSSLQQRFEFEPFSISRPPKPNVVDNDRYRAVLSGGPGRLFRALAVTLRNAARFPWVVWRSKVDIVQLHSSDYWSFWESSLYLLMARLLGRRCVMRFGGCFDSFYEGSSGPIRALIRWILRRPDVVLVQSESWRRFFSTIAPHTEIRILPNSIATSGAEVPGRGSTEVRALFLCGSEAKRKGIETVLAALRLLDGRVPELRVELIAAGEAIRWRVDSLGLEQRVRLHDVCDRETMARHLARADIFLLPSFREGFPNSLLEAMAAGLAVITTPVGAIPEVIDEGVGALIVTPGDAEELASALERLTLDAELRARFGEANRQRVARDFERDRVFERLGQVYGELVRV